ncbi:tRNA threonylcarbamoyladenosine dehydratase [Curvibacter sp. AEP1-3]|uniref:tRNA threonylcarbamoyladenosine dehydratase n=1 Tax=Curvibacter sp. AEP1-3 TaxID=1844971 RepID=UPI000B58670B|nr:tRNA threonylcarbamoyladenosine dehydratase [Curvibacter sp. AEP1-3]
MTGIASGAVEAADLNRRFSGIDRLFGVEPAGYFRNSHVAVVGIGGVGSWAVEALARSGIAALTLIDMDHVSESNINRQLHALTSTIGMSKIEAMRERIADINPACRVVVVDDFVDEDNWPAILGGQVDAVIDACDNVKAKVAMAAWSRETKVPFVSVGAAGGKRLAHLVDISDLSQTTHDPLLAQLRYRLRKSHGAPKDGKKMKVACVYSKEAVRGPDASCAVEGDGTLNCHGYGSLVSVTATFGMCAAGWVIDKLSAPTHLASKKTL